MIPDRRTPFLPALAAAALFATAAQAEAPQVVVTIKPIHSLVSAVMQGVGEPKLLVQGAGSGHSYSMRPSDARALQDASVIFYVGDTMETFLPPALASLGGDAEVVEIAEIEGIELLPFREGGPFEGHDHAGADDGHSHAHDHQQKASAGSDHDHAHAHDEEPRHSDGHAAGHDHAAEKPAAHRDHAAHGDSDMHLWLDPENARRIVAAAADILAKRDPDNAETYRRNAETYDARLVALSGQIREQLAGVSDKPVVVFHDAYQYFEKRFGVNVVGSITVSPERAPSAQRVSEIRERIAGLGATCVFAEPQFEPRIVGVVTEGTSARSGVLDPLGAEIADGPDLYPALLEGLATSLKTCISDAS